VARRAADLGPVHEPGAIVVLAHRTLLDRRKEARPTGSRVELGVGGEERRAAAHAIEHAFALLVVERVRERPLGAMLPGDGILLGCQPPLPLVVALIALHRAVCVHVLALLALVAGPGARTRALAFTERPPPYVVRRMH